MKNSFFSRFAPKETKFFPLLKQLSEIVLSASELLMESLKHESPEERSEYYKKIKDVERQGDQLTNRIFEELGKTFITPFDREDIHDLASSTDDIIDCINSAAKRIAISHKVHVTKPHIGVVNSVQGLDAELTRLAHKKRVVMVMKMGDVSLIAITQECISIILENTQMLRRIQLAGKVSRAASLFTEDIGFPTHSSVAFVKVKHHLFKAALVKTRNHQAYGGRKVRIIHALFPQKSV